MILIDALYINNGGGKILLDYLMMQLNRQAVPATYLLDERIRNNRVQTKATDTVIIMKAGLRQRKRFYKEHKSKFSRVLCFGNLPPNIKINAQVYTYFHQPMFLAIPHNIKGFSRLVFHLKSAILNSIKKNTDYWLVQSMTIKNELVAKYKLEENNVLIMPFYPPISMEGKSYPDRVEDGFVYVSSGEKHKNQIRLLHAFAAFYDKHKRGSLTLTISDNYKEEITLISDLQRKEYPITNLGFLNRDDLGAVYHKNKYLIFPSLAESFGLGIVEAIEHGCAVIGADLPYMHAVCVPSLTFDPLNTGDIEEAFRKAVFEDVNKSVSLINNKIDDLIKCLIG